MLLNKKPAYTAGFLCEAHNSCTVITRGRRLMAGPLPSKQLARVRFSPSAQSMPKFVIDVLALIGAIGIALAVVLFVQSPISSEPVYQQSEKVTYQEPEFTEQEEATSTPVAEQVENDDLFPEQVKEPPKEQETPQKTAEEPIAAATEEPAVQQTSHNLYSFPPHDAATLNTESRAALVNVLCESSSSSLKSTSGSGIIIDPRGVILTNAHIGQHVLLSEYPNIPLACVIRAGSPAKNTWRARMLYIPPAWVEKHAPDIEKLSATGTGEDDYALLLITESFDGSPLPASFPFIPADTREAITSTNESVLVAAYPAEFVGSAATRRSLYASTATSLIKEALTFLSGTFDVISLGGTPLAQSGSSGGAVVNAWGQLVGIVVTTSEGDTTGERDLRAITPAHINRSISAYTGESLSAFLADDLLTTAAALTLQNSELLEILVENASQN